MLTMFKNCDSLIISIGSAVFLLLISPLVCEAELTVLPIESQNEGFFIGEDMPRWDNPNCGFQKGHPSLHKKHTPKLCKIEGCNNKYLAKGLCRKHYDKQWEEKNKKRRTKSKKLYRQEHREEALEYHKQYRIDNKERRAEYNKQHRLDNKEHYTKYKKQWLIDNKKYCRKYFKQYYLDNKKHITNYQQENKKHISERMKKYLKTPAGKIIKKTCDHRRRDLLKDLKTAIIQQVYEDNIKKYGVLTCYLCFKPITDNDDSLEHSIPVTREGSSKYENLGVAHKRCNSQKHTMTKEEWFVKQGVLGI